MKQVEQFQALIQSNRIISDRNKNRRTRKENEIVYTDSVSIEGYLLPIMNKEHWGCYRSALLCIHSQLKNLLSYHCKVFCVRFDFHVSPDHWEEGQFSTFMKGLNNQLKYHYKLKRIAYIWCREQSINGYPHYHLMLAVDGSKVNYPHRLESMLTARWEKLGHPHPHRCNHHMISNTLDDEFKDAFVHFSYLAKTHTKDNQPINLRNFSSSRIEPSPNSSLAYCS